MYFMEQQFLTESEVFDLIQESASDPAAIQLREELFQPIIDTLNDIQKMKEYIKIGNEYLEANAEMLAKPYPTKQVVFPRKYVDRVVALFGYDVKSLKSMIKTLLQKYINQSDWLTITSYPSNVIHALVLVYTDMISTMRTEQTKDDRNNLRDSARQQLGLTVYYSSFLAQFPPPHPVEGTMAYTYMHLNRSWKLVRDEDMVTWIGNTVEIAYQFYRTKMSLDLTPKLLVDFLNRTRNGFKQNLCSLANRYFKDIDEKNSVAEDMAADDSGEYVEKTEFSTIRNNLIRKISGGDELYKRMNDTYRAIANLKTVKADELFSFAQKVSKKDLARIIDTIFYVFITKEGNRFQDINSSKYIGRITKFPTAIDRAISGQPIIQPMVDHYEVNSNLVKAYICFVATYILQRFNIVFSENDK